MNKNKKEIVELLAKIKDPKLMGEFLEDLLTPEEFEVITKRLQLVKMLNSGVPQREISKKLGVAIATVTRGSRQLNESDGFNKILKKYYAK